MAGNEYGRTPEGSCAMKRNPTSSLVSVIAAELQRTRRCDRFGRRHGVSQRLFYLRRESEADVPICPGGLRAGPQ